MKSILKAQNLPIEGILDDIKSALSDHHELVLQAPPGAGKTTIVPLALLNEPWLLNQKIIMLEPRRIATRAAAERMADLLDEKVGETVGYRVRMDTKTSKHTRIEVVTEGILNRMLQDDTSLEDIGLIIFDEFHERSLNGDLGLALALQGRELFADLRDQPLKILVMSATLDGEKIGELLDDAPIVSSEGRSFPIDIIYGQAAKYQAQQAWGDRITDRVASTIFQALEEQTGSLLVFLPGQGEIREVNKLISRTLTNRSDILITPLFGSLSLQEQRKAIQPAPANIRKIVLTTALAETSLTIDGVRVVIDSGLARLPEYDPKTAMTRLKTERVSKASAKQRAGRAGRTEPGVCYRLWSEDQQQSLASYTAPEIEQADLTPLALQLFKWGISEPEELRWMTTPAKAPFQQATELLRQLGAIDNEANALTSHGEAMAQLPLHPRLAHMLIISLTLGHARLACQIAALLSERDPLDSPSSDIESRLELINGDRPASQSNKHLLSRIQQLAKQFERTLNQLHITPQPQPKLKQISINANVAAGLLTALAYPDRIALRQSENSYDYKLSNGRQAVLSQNDSIQRHPVIAIIQLGGHSGSSKDKIYLASPLNIEKLKEISPNIFQQTLHIDWNDRTSRLVAEEQTLIGKLVVERKAINNIPKEQKNKALTELVRRKGLELLPWTPELKSWCARIELIRKQAGNNQDLAWPDMSNKGLLSDMESWLLPYLDEVSHINHFKKLDLKALLATRLPWPLPQQLNTLAPERIQVPSGSNILIDYTQTPPVLAVKLQEMFGQQDTPAIAKGKVKLLIHLLSPARRPLQVTQDLAGFWKSSYQDVKKEMKGRYPKHHWPDDPSKAEPTARINPRTKKYG